MSAGDCIQKQPQTLQCLRFYTESVFEVGGNSDGYRHSFQDIFYYLDIFAFYIVLFMWVGFAVGP